MADETTLRLRIEADASGVNTALSTTQASLKGFEAETKRVEQQLNETSAAADRAGRQFLQLGESTHVSFGKLQSGMVAATVAGNALFASLDGLARAFAAPIAELLDAEQASAMLQGTFGGLSSEIERVQATASQLAANNAFFDDDALAQAAGTLKLFGANADAIQELLPYVNDLAIAFGVDVNDAAQLVGQALVGQTRGLARMVPEIRGANSQLEVLAALQASSARNTEIAKQRTEGLGGQLALLKRQAADAAQGFGTALLPAINFVLKAMNDNLLPVVGKVMAAFAGLGAFFSNLGKGLNLSDLSRVAGEAILKAEAQFKAVNARVEQRVSRVSQQSANLSLAGSFGGGGSGGGAASGGRQRTTTANEDEREAARTREESVRRTAAIQRELQAEFTRAAKDVADYYERARQTAARMREADAAAVEREASMQQRIADEADKMREEVYRASVKQQQDVARAYGDAMTKVIQGDISGALSSAVSAAGQQFGSAIADDIPLLRESFGDAFAGGLEAVGPVAGGIFAKIVDLGISATIKAVQSIYDGMNRIVEAFARYREESDRLNESATRSFEERQIRFLAKRGAITEEEAGKRLGAVRAGASVATAIGVTGRQDFEQGISSLFSEIANNPELRKGAEEAIKKGGMQDLYDFLGKAGREGKLSTAEGAGLNWLTSTLFTGRGEAGFKAFFSNLADYLDTLQPPEDTAAPATTGQTANVEVGTIQQGTSPDRPVYVFDVRPREGFGFAPESFFFRNRGAGTSRAIAGTPLPVAQGNAVFGSSRVRRYG